MPHNMHLWQTVLNRPVPVYTARHVARRDFAGPFQGHDQGMEIEDLTNALGYAGNPNFLTADAWGRAGDYAHIFRRASERMKLHGVYTLRQPASKASKRDALIPVVYVCEASSEPEAHEFRRLTWNQNAAPFLIVKTPARIRLFSSFNCPVAGPSAITRSVSPTMLDRTIEFERIADELAAVTGNAIDQGIIWQEYGRFVTPQERVDWTLLGHLEQLDDYLIDSDLDWRASHALIGKYVYLWYLRQRNIVSDARLDEWGINKDHLFSGDATLTAFKKTFDKLDDWLNGSIFPLDWTRSNAPKQEHLRKVAGIFAGDTVDGQLHLPFDAYDFSVIPVETLSAIYERFLHAHEPQTNTSRGKELGAYYTPLSVVNFMLEELDDKRPLADGMTCFDAACGSGAFLVQCYRRLIENRVRKDGQAIRKPRELRDILESSIYGVDRDEDACRVTELSLILTLLDYVKPPDLLPVHNFKLPDLHDKNIFHADFFDPGSAWADMARDKKFDWVVGNPPWVVLKSARQKESGKNVDDESAHALQWIKENNAEMPVSGGQLAEAFLWKVTEHLKADGQAAMLMPSMTLFKNQARAFRARFFQRVQVSCLVNFANLRRVLFAGRSIEPAAAFFYGRHPEGKQTLNTDATILTYSPFVANQESNRPRGRRQRKDTWSITINGSEIREVPVSVAASGDPMVWKLAMWGSYLDSKLLASAARKSETFSMICERLKIKIHEGVQLRVTPAPSADNRVRITETITHVKELEDKHEIITAKLRGCGRIYAFPQSALATIPKARANVREGRGELPVLVSRPPHVILDPARRFAVYSDEFLAVPPRWVGIAGSSEQKEILKAIALYLVSDFATYHQFLTSAEMGVYKPKADLRTLREMPIPLANMQRQGLGRWANLYDQLAQASLSTARRNDDPESSTYPVDSTLGDVARLEAEVNRLTYEALHLRQSDIALVADLVHCRRFLIEGNVGPLATGAPSGEEMRSYCEMLKRQLDAFFEVATQDRHSVEVVYEGESAMIVVERGPARPMRQSIKIIPAGDDAATALKRVRDGLVDTRRQWLYFQRDLRKYQNGTTYLFKPMQRIHWLRSQALVDAGEVFADRTGGRGA